MGGYTQDQIDECFAEDDETTTTTYPMPNNADDRLKILPSLLLNQGEGAHRLRATAKLTKIKKMMSEISETKKKLKVVLQEYNDAIFNLPEVCCVKARNKKEDMGVTSVNSQILRLNSIYDAI